MNEIKHIAEFREILENYKLSESAAKILADTRLVLLVAPTSSGRNTIIRELLKTGDYHFIVSDTTRKPRLNNGVLEENGREYWFRTEEEMLDELRHGEFLEAALIHNQQVSGISIRELRKAEKDKRVAINDVQVDGALHIHQAKPDALIIFMVPPTFEIWMERIHRRGPMQADELRRRLESAAAEFKTALSSNFYRFVVNDTIAGTTEEINTFAVSGYYDPLKERFARSLAESLYQETLDYLKKNQNSALPSREVR